MERAYYSFVFRVSPEVSGFVDGLRRELQETGCNPQANDNAHIPILEFEASEEELAIFREYASKASGAFQAGKVQFKGLAAFKPSPGRDNGSLYFAPAPASAQYLKSFTESFHADFPLKGKVGTYYSPAPQLTLARRLTAVRLETAQELLKGFPLKFEAFCDGIDLCRYDGVSRKFVPESAFGFIPADASQVALPQVGILVRR